ncbi:hypothetical protein [Pseudohongiella spirulinae]|uniref:Lipoprotein n=1 Tax=Pseudohongiella spirulinae TaxID=1249552 RepID=A0A0S2K9P1_9GAMM|nr:hypothetical protein [Pseudohongiella spirulinae]ALO45052.1 hypothetical protein PS2015_363 [Pseudohongiella spirulinae]
MKPVFALITLVSACLTATPGALAVPSNLPADIWAVGTAWTQDQQRVQYYEYHYADNPELDLPTRVEYRDPGGRIFASKKIDYSDSLIAPSVSQQDYRNQAQLQTEHSAEPAAQVIRVNFRPHDSDQLQQTEIATRDTLIVDAGFDPFVRKHWDNLVGGRRVTADFLVPARMDSVRISVSRTDTANCPADSQPLHCFVIRPAGLLRVVGWLVDPIYIGYHQETRRLLVFNGLSNLRDDAGEPRNALIKFEYF